MPRKSHADWEPSPSRPDPIDLIEEQAKTRVPELVPIRYERMLVSPFAFLRGAALIMTADLAPTRSSGFEVQLCGDAHLSNFGVFGTPERRLVFDVNDFDETNPGPWEWDVKRLAASVVVAARDRGFTAVQVRATVLAALAEYRTAMGSFAGMSGLDVWYAHLDVDQLFAQTRDDLDRRTVKQTEAELAKAKTRDNLRALSKLTETVDGELRIVSQPPLIVPIEELVHGVEYDQLHEWLVEAVRDYRETLSPDHQQLLDRYQLVHFARKVVGVGSVGTRTWIALFVGRDVGDPLFLQIKEAQASVLEAYLGRSVFENHAERVISGQRLMQAASDVFLGWKRVAHDEGQYDFYLRQLHDWKGRVEIDEMTPETMTGYVRMCGWSLARAHARSGDRIEIAAYLGAGVVFDQAVASFAELYADQNERDYQALAAAVASGRIQAAPSGPAA